LIYPEKYRNQVVLDSRAIDQKNIDPRTSVSSPISVLELGMGIEPIYSGSAGRRLDRSATPASLDILKTEINTISMLQAFP
jgi:hypothetical protein